LILKCLKKRSVLHDYSWDNLVVSIGSTTKSTLKFEDVVSSLLYKEMRSKSMEGFSKDALFVRDHPQDRNKNKSSGIGLNLEVDLNIHNNL
jgi:hypothetical protein